jgi:hypothetical protein
LADAHALSLSALMAEPPYLFAQCGEHVVIARICLSRPGLNGWERDLLTGIQRTLTPSAKQVKVLFEITEKVDPNWL